MKQEKHSKCAKEKKWFTENPLEKPPQTEKALLDDQQALEKFHNSKATLQVSLPGFKISKLTTAEICKLYNHSIFSVSVESE